MSGYYQLTIGNVQRETRDAITVTFHVPRELKNVFRFVQGQHVNVRATLRGEEVRRSYSICSAVQDDLLRIAIKRMSGGLFSNWANDNLKPGCTLDVMPPLGRFYVPLSAENNKHYVAIAVGSGITPIFSIIKTTLLTEPFSRFTLFYGNRSSGSIILREELADLKDVFLERLSLVHILTREQQDIDLFNGRINGEKCKKLFSQWCPLPDVDTVFLCGPEDMIEEVSGTLRAQGLPKSHVKVELFGRSRRSVHMAVASGRETCEVTLVVDGVRNAFPLEKEKESILDGGLRHGIDLRHSCKGGVCGTCRAKLLQGQVDMDAHFALEDYEIKRGFILTCQSYPVSDSVVVDFDQAH